MTLYRSFILLALLFSLTFSATRYVVDSHKFNLRSIPAHNGKILAMLPSGTRVRTLKVEKGWSKVTYKGKTGWIVSSFLMPTPAYKDRFAALEESMQKIETENRELKDKWNTSSKSETSLSKDLSSRKRKIETLEKEYAAFKKKSANYITLQGQYDSLVNSMDSTKLKNDTLLVENKELLQSEAKMWFLIGAGIILLGFIFGFSFGKKEKKKRYQY